MPTNGQFAVGELVTASDANTLFTRGYTNRIINGAFVINQRSYVSGTNLASGSYGFDRWKSGYTNTALTFTAGSQSTTVTISASGVLQQIVERENMPAGTYTLSWTGTATGRIYNSGGTAPAYAASPITVTLDGSANVVVEFTASGGTKTLSLVQLQAGTVYSPFEYRPIGLELHLCYRYYFRMIDPVGSGTGNGNPSRLLHPLPTYMRAVPTSTSSGTLNFYNGGGTTVSGSPAISAAYNTRTVGQIDYNSIIGVAGQAIVMYSNGGTQYIDFSAEL